MPTHTAHSALVKLWYASDGAPWTFPNWKEITDVQHGLFPEDDAHLPPGWTRVQANQIRSYFEQYQAKKTEDEKIKFAGHTRKVGKDVVPGRALWRNFVTVNYSKSWNVHGRISSILHDVGIHPVQLMAAQENFDEYPGSVSYLPIALDSIATALFGTECLDKTGHLQRDLRDPTLILLQRTWEQLRKAHVRDYARVRTCEEMMNKTLASK